jgi:aspartate carbamoyltransferase catalytic subunit
VRIVGPESLLKRDGLIGVPAYTDLEEGIEGADVVLMLRIQRERMQAAVQIRSKIFTAATASRASGSKRRRPMRSSCIRGR